MKCDDYRKRVESPGPKRLLSLDGGGIRGLISIEILARLERLLRDAYRDEQLVLADFFDYVAGTSTGAILAAGVALGLPVERIKHFYDIGAKKMLNRAPFFQRWYHSFQVAGFTKHLQDLLGDTRFGDPGLPGLPSGDARKAYALKTLLLLVMHRCETDSPWVLSNNHKAKYNDVDKYPESKGNNLYIPLWQLVRASSAAPTYFEPEVITIGTEECEFEDGAVTPFNNPSFLLYVMSTLDEYRLCWKTGEDQMLLVSVGTGSLPNVEPEKRIKQMNLLYNARRIPSALIYASTVEADKLCRISGRCTYASGIKIDSEIGDLVRPESGPTGRAFTYVRYDPDLTETGLEQLDVRKDIKPEDVLPLISTKHLRELEEVGRAFARKHVRLEHLRAFDPRRASENQRMIE